MILMLLKRLFCIHAWEHDKDINGDDVQECRRCEKRMMK